jgi:lysophospholipase L1-like esterase
MAAAALLTVPANAATAVEEAPGPLRVMISGDSITQGYHGDYTWRMRLAHEFARQGRSFDLVGPRDNLFIDGGYTTSRYADPRFDRDHASLVGLQLGALAKRIGSEVAEYSPDVVVIPVGLNDLVRGAGPAVALDRLRTVIRNARLARPGVHVVVTPVLRINRAAFPDLNKEIDAYDAQLPQLVRELDTPVARVMLADTTRGWKPVPTFSVDGVHLSPTGETLFAQRVAEALHAEGFLPAAPAIERTVPWSRTLAPVVRIRGDRAVLAWSRQRISGARTYMHGLRRTTVSSSYEPRGTSTLKIREGATYLFRLQLRRVWLTGPWGPVVKVPTPARPSRVSVSPSGVAWTAGRNAESYVVRTRLSGSRTWKAWRVYAPRRVLRLTRVAEARVTTANRWGWSTPRAGG